MECRARCKAGYCDTEIRTWAETKSWTRNWLHHPGAPCLVLISIILYGPTYNYFKLQHKYFDPRNLTMGLQVSFYTRFWSPSQCHPMNRPGLAYPENRIREPRSSVVPSDRCNISTGPVSEVIWYHLAPDNLPNDHRHMTECRWDQESGLNQKKIHPELSTKKCPSHYVWDDSAANAIWHSI